MLFRALKFATAAAYLYMLWLTFKFIIGELDWGLASGAIGISGFWLLMTGFRLRQLFSTYFDVFSRLKILVPMSIGLVFAALTLLLGVHWSFKAVAALELLAWLGVFIAYRRNRRNYIVAGQGPLPAECWVNPPAQILVPGDLILTSGRIATRMHEAVGHGEIVIPDEKGRLCCFSSYMEDGAVWHRAEAICNTKLKHGHYIVMRLKHPLTAAQIESARTKAYAMLKQNAAWREATNKRRAAIIAWLPLPASWKQKLTRRFQATGYDWPGLFIGTQAKGRWTCIAACLEVYHHLGVKTARYGTGLLGLGTGVLEPIMPVRFLADPAFRLLTTEDQRAYEAAKPAVK